MTGKATEDAGRPAGIEAARVHLRHAGYCVHCDRIVERAQDGSCPAGHPAEGVTGRILLADDAPVPGLPRFNLAAFLIPPIWGPAHGQWAGAIFLPLWLFADSVVRSAGVAPGGWAGAVIVLTATLAAQAWFGKRANGLAWRRVCDRVGVDEFGARQRVWAAVAVPVAAVLLGAAIYFDTVVLPTRTQ